MRGGALKNLRCEWDATGRMSSSVRDNGEVVEKRIWGGLRKTETRVPAKIGIVSVKSCWRS